MAKTQSASGPASAGWLRGNTLRIRRFYEDVRSEMSKVAWPTRDELKEQTYLVLIMLGIMAFIIAVLDNIFKWVVVGILNIF